MSAVSLEKPTMRRCVKCGAFKIDSGDGGVYLFVVYNSNKKDARVHI